MVSVQPNRAKYATFPLVLALPGIALYGVSHIGADGCSVALCRYLRKAFT